MYFFVLYSSFDMFLCYSLHRVVQVLHVAEDVLDKLQFAMKGKSEDEQCVGPCFIQLAEQMKLVYGQYCMNHDNALVLLEKVSTDICLR